MTVRIEGVEALRAQLERLGQAVDAAALLTPLGDEVVGTIQDTVRNTFGGTGAYAASWRAEVEGEELTIGSDAPQAAIQEFGGVVRARGDYLRFQVDGQWVQTRAVTIPPRPHARPALEGLRDKLAAAIVRLVEGAL